VPRVPAGMTANEYVSALASRGMRPQALQTVTINGNRAVLASYLMRTEGGALGALAGFIEYQNQIFQIFGITPDFQRFGAEIERSLHALQCVDLFLNRVGNQLFAVAVLQDDTAEVILGRLMSDLLERHVDAAVNNGAGNRNKNPQFLLGDDNTEAIRNVGNES